MVDDNARPTVIEESDANTQTEHKNICPQEQHTPEKLADRPHPISVRLGLVSPTIAVVALIVAFMSLWTNQRSMKVGQSLS